MTTISTVGLGEVRPFDNSAKVFSIILSVVGVSIALFALGAVFEEQLQDTLDRYGRRRMDRRIGRLDHHVVLCGYGRVGGHIAKLMSGNLVVIDVDARRLEQAADDGYAVVEGSCTEDDVLTRAGIESAVTLIISLGTDADAISAVLSARALNPKLRIIARANETSSEAKLRRAGCDHVVNPLHQGAHRMAAFAEQPDVADFLDVVVHAEEVEYRLEEFPVRSGSPIAGQSLGGVHLRRRTGALVLAVRDGEGSFRSNPDPDVLLEPGTTLIAIGTSSQLADLLQVVEG